MRTLLSSLHSRGAKSAVCLLVLTAACAGTEPPAEEPTGGGASAGAMAGASAMAGAATAGAAGGGGAAGSGGAAAGGNNAMGGASAPDTNSSGGSVAAGGAEVTAGAPSAGSGGNAAAGGNTGSPPTARTTCPEAPPAATKDPAADRNLVVSKDEYSQMFSAMEPFQGTRGALPWHLHTPEQAVTASEERYPLVVILHGGYGREVADGNIMVDVAPYLLGAAGGLLTEENRAAYPAYVLAPHCRQDEGCDFGRNEWAAPGGLHYQVADEPSVAGGTALELIEHVIADYQVDAQRVYVTGNSMGGGGTWEFALRRPELFAAALPVSGHPPALEFLKPITEAKLPVWAFGGANDTTNPYPDTVEAVATLNSGAGCAWLTTYNNTGHDDALWSSPYLEPGLWPWLFAQVNPSAPAP